MPTVITGTDGVSQVQAGAVESGDIAAGVLSGLINIQTFASGGTSTYNKTPGTERILVYVTGGGGTGGSQGMGGGAGGTAIKLIDASSLGNVSVQVSNFIEGPGGAGDGFDGGTSSFGSFCSASGGKGGLNGASTEFPAEGGVGSNGDINLRGGFGSTTRGGGGSSFWGATFIITNGANAGFYGAGGRGGEGGIESYAGAGGAVVVFEYGAS